MFLEPVQNSGGCFPPPPGYFQRVREICDQLRRAAGVRRGDLRVRAARATTSARERYGYQPDIITFAKGVTSGLRAARRHDRARRADGAVPARHGDVPARRHVRRPPGVVPRSRWPTSTSSRRKTCSATCGPTRAPSAPPWRSCTTCRSSATSAGDGYFYGIELVKDKATRETFNDDESERLLRGFLSHGAVRRRADLPGRRPRRPGDPARPAADLRPGALRRDRADPARGPHRGLEADLERRGPLGSALVAADSGLRRGDRTG